MKIAFFNYLMLEYGGGTARFFIDASLGLKARYPNLDISIITLDKSLTETINRLYSFYFQRNVNEELRVTDDNLRSRLKKGGVSYVTAKSFAELRQTLHGFDWVYSKNDILEAFILKFFVGYKNLNQVVFGFHTPTFYERVSSLQARFHNLMYGSYFYKFLLGKAKKFHVLNSFDERSLKHSFKDKRVYKIYNPFDFRKYESNTQRNKERLNLLWVGRLTREKGADDLIKLIKVINSSAVSKKIFWNVVGIGELEEKIKNLVEEFDNVRYLGYIENKQMAQIYKDNDIFLSTSRWESFPYTFLEAQTFGLPIISYNIHGCNEIVKDGVNGYLVNSIDEYKEKLVYLVQNQKKIIKKDFIKKRIRKMVNSEEIYKKLYELLQ